MTIPVVSVLMSVFNGEMYLQAAVDSILDQTFEDFEFIIVDDGSTDSCPQILATYQDPRIKIITQANVGLTRSLNRAISLAQGKYLARMDADDISLPTRFQKQVEFLNEHLNVGVLGTGCVFQDEIEGVKWEPVTLTEHDDMVAQFLKGNPITHPSVMMRKSVVERVSGYDERYPFSQDYALWVLLAQQTKLANIPDVLLIHREHQNTVSTVRQANIKKVLFSLWVEFKIRFRAFRTYDYPLLSSCYILSPIVYAFIELNPTLADFLKRVLGIKPQKKTTLKIQ